MITNYTRPQTEIAEQLATIPNPLLDRIHAVVVGPAYLHADIATGNMVAHSYQASGELGYSLVRNGLTVARHNETVDQSNVTVVAKDLRLTLFSDKAGFAPLGTDKTGAVVKYASTFLNTGDPSVAATYDAGRPPTPGDIYRLASATYTTVERKVVALLGVDQAAVFGPTLYTGATGDGSSTVAESVAVAYSNFTPGTVSVSAGQASHLYARRFGAFGAGTNNGLRLVVELTCSAASAAPTFTATINGLASNVVRSNTGGSTFTLATDLAIVINRTATTWQIGDRVVFNVDLDFNSDTTKFDTAFSLTAYTYATSVKRVSSAIVVDVLSLADNGAPTIRISDTAGLMVPITKVLASTNNTATLSYDGSTLAFALNSISFWRFHVGQRYVLPLTPPSRSTTVFDKIQFNAPIGNLGNTITGITATAYTGFSGTLPPVEAVLAGTNYTADASKVTLAALSHSVPGYPTASTSVRTAADGYGQVSVAWRALIPVSATQGLVAIDLATDILDNYFSYDLNSELGYGLRKAFIGSQGKRVYALNTGGTSAEAFRAAFDKLEASIAVYTIAVLTEDEEIMKMASTHSATMSAPTVKRFRRAYVGTDSPGEYPVLNAQADGTAYTASIGQGSGGTYTQATLHQSVDLTLLPISYGDKLAISGTEYVIDQVTGPDTLDLVAGPASPISETPCTILAADTPENTARFVWQRSTRLGDTLDEDRRIANIWQDAGTKGGVVIPNRFGACEVAGICTALQPQQGLTRTEVSHIDSAPSMYTRFKPALLDQMAANGVWIISQNSAEGVCYVRHQLTTAVSNGSLYYEDSAGTNVDSVCFAIDDICDPMIGKRNATPRTVVELKNLLQGLLSGLTQDSYSSVIGPQLAGFYNSNGDPDTLDVAINALFKDRIDVAVVLEIPLPLNNVMVVVLSRTISASGVAVTTISTSVNSTL